MTDVSATIGNMSVKYSPELLLTVEVTVKRKDAHPVILGLSYSEALILSDLLSFVMSHTSRVRVRKSIQAKGTE